MQKYWHTLIASLALAGVVGLAGKAVADAGFRGTVTEFMSQIEKRLDRIEQKLDDRLPAAPHSAKDQ